ncbi:MAG: hypothetical protein KGJ23_07980 [Euryarchaeota archaeon]|nr:hypothetical protein [Euryarchaeota archaeon]MDE1836539.1 hypothetical protein [Euryarchaeota archaeon]MDE1879266.1 hypothetical protein [Euryarchaeota archaeon]MDE2044509.1 hypothetical protein [Thermoplasmata archaeon]
MTGADVLTHPFAAVMDRDGFLPPMSCRNCGKPLEGDGSGHPAELYAGTWNGLCYPCTGAPAFKSTVEDLSGVEVWSHPPHCPAWRRDRETFLYVPGCGKCDHGRIMVSRSMMLGGSYPVQCGDCSRAHHGHPKVRDEVGFKEAVRELVPQTTLDLDWLVEPILRAERRAEQGRSTT